MVGSPRRCSISACSATRPSTASNTCQSPPTPLRPPTHEAPVSAERGPARRVELLVCRLRGRLLSRLLGGGVALLEPCHATTGVEDLLLAGVEGVALRADVGVDRPTLDRAPRGEGVAAGAGHLGVVVLGVGVLLHGVLSRGSVAGSSRAGT